MKPYLQQHRCLVKPLLVACAIAFCVAGCRDEFERKQRSQPTRITQCQDGLEVEVFFMAMASAPTPEKVEFRKDGKVVTRTWNEEVPLQKVVSPDQKWILLQELKRGGFKFCPEPQIMQCLEDGRKFVRIIETSGAPEFLGYTLDSWEEPHTVLITLNAGEKSEKWKADLEKRELTRIDQSGPPMFKPVFVESKK
ncbi:MAG: hypothetical protein NTY98_04295 [Verrucomicrobia bacterium]|nr:hypothetical protein [Verrucomicrobiota bacterium]